MITRSEFKSYTLDQKVTALYERGTFIMAIRYYNYKINLYLLEKEYVEVFVNHKHSNIEKISLLDSTHSRMKFYYDQIKLPSVVIGND